MKLCLPTSTDIAHKKVLLRVDFNVPLERKDDEWKVSDDTRIQAALETINFLLQHQAQVILLSHLGRPDGKVDSDLSLAPIAKHMSQLINQSVPLITNFQTQDTPIQLLENLRFYAEEEANNKTFAQKLASLGEVYIDEAFSAAHRAHASVEGITHFLPSFAGFAFAQEVEHLSQLISNPKRPFVMIIGGAKISDKVSAIANLTNVADTVLVGGGVANNFLKADGFDVAESYLEDTAVDKKKKTINFVKFADTLLDSNQQEHTLLNEYLPLPKIIYPIDVVAATSKDATKTQVIDLTTQSDVEDDLMFLDIGPKTIKLFQAVIAQAKTIFWNGPMGVFEQQPFAKGTHQIAQSIAQSKANSVLGGGDTIASIDEFELRDQFSYVSAAGGASLEFLSGKMLPGVKPLICKSDKN